ncbi:MAG: DUF6531 domain-containing protein [Candidatus Hodarchaeota archaeon]
MGTDTMQTNSVPVDLENRFVELRRSYLNPSRSEEEKEELRETLLNMVPSLNRDDLIGQLVEDFGEENVYGRLNSIYRDEFIRNQYSEFEDLIKTFRDVSVEPNKGKNATRKTDSSVTLFSGQFVHKSKDLALKGVGLHFNFVRTYKSQAIYSGPLGANWDHSYNLYLREEDGGQRVVRSNGSMRESTYLKDEESGTFKIPNGSFNKLSLEECFLGTTALGYRYVLETTTGTRYIYKKMESGFGFYKAEYIEDRFGNYLEFIYDGLRLEKIYDTLRKEIKFAYDQYDRITTIIYDNRQVDYCYDDNNDLCQVFLPQPEEDKKRPVINYEYTSPDYPFPLLHKLTAITDPEGHRYLENDYCVDKGFYDYNKIIRQRLGKGESTYEYSPLYPEYEAESTKESRPAYKTIVKTRHDQEVEYVFNHQGNMLCECEKVRGTNNVIKSISSEYQYNKDGNVIWQKNALGNITQFKYGREAFVGDSPLAEEKRKFGNLIRVIQRSKSSTSASFDNFEIIDPKDIVVNYEYDNQYNLRTSQTDPRNEEYKTEFLYARDPENYGIETSEDDGRYLTKIIFPQTTLPNGLIQQAIKKFKYNKKGQIKEAVTERNTVIRDNEVVVIDEGQKTTTRYYYFGEAVDDEPGVTSEDYKNGYPYLIKFDAGEDTDAREYLSISISFDVDRFGNVIKMTDGKGNETTQEYDNLDRLLKTVLPL